MRTFKQCPISLIFGSRNVLLSLGVISQKTELFIISNPSFSVVWSYGKQVYRKIRIEVAYCGNRTSATVGVSSRFGLSYVFLRFCYKTKYLNCT
jgi:hypothetical protein